MTDTPTYEQLRQYHIGPAGAIPNAPRHTHFLTGGVAKEAPNLVTQPGHLLRMAAETIEQRGQERDNGEGGERSMAATVAAFNAIEGTDLTERQGWAFMQTLKLVRAASTARNGRYNQDDYIDGAAYAALGAECASKA